MRPAAPITPPPGWAADKCESGASRASDRQTIASLRVVIEDECPCASFDGTSSTTNRGAFLRCVKQRINDASDGTALLGFSLRKQCKSALKKIYTLSTCGYPAGERVSCCEVKPATLKKKASIKKTAKCVDAGSVVRNACPAFAFTADACSFDLNNTCNAVPPPFAQETVDIPSAAEPAETPGTSGVVVTNPKLLTQFGGPGFKDELPYVVAIVELDEGPRMMGNVTDVDPETVRIGDRVQVWFADAGERAHIPLWRPLD